MADFKTLVNDVLDEINEPNITTVTGNVGIQKVVVNSVLKAVRFINNAEKEWPYLFSSGSQSLTPGTQFYNLPTTFRSIDWESFIVRPAELLTNTTFASNITSWTDVSTGTGSAVQVSAGNGRARLAGGSSGVGALRQSTSTINNDEYILVFRAFTNTVTLRIGSTAGGTDIVNDTTHAIADAGEGTFFRVKYSAAGATTFIEFRNPNNNNADVDLATVNENLLPRPLEYIDFDEWRITFKPNEILLDPDVYDIPTRVFRNQADQFGVSTVPDKTYTVEFDHWTDPTEMSVDTSTPSIPSEWHDTIRERTLFYMYRFRNHADEMFTARDNAKDGIKQMRIKLINYPQRMKNTNVGSVKLGGKRASSIRVTN